MDNLPNTLIVLKIVKYFQNSLNNLPDSIKYLYIGISKNNFIKYLDDLYIENKSVFNLKIEKLPKNLKKLYIFGKYKYIGLLKDKIGDKLVVID